MCPALARRDDTRTGRTVENFWQILHSANGTKGGSSGSSGKLKSGFEFRTHRTHRELLENLLAKTKMNTEKKHGKPLRTFSSAGEAEVASWTASLR